MKRACRGSGRINIIITIHRREVKPSVKTIELFAYPWWYTKVHSNIGRGSMGICWKLYRGRVSYFSFRHSNASPFFLSKDGGREGMGPKTMNILDLTGAAFDSILYRKIWNAWEERNIPPNLINALQSIYQDPKDLVALNVTKSSPLRSYKGVKQGDSLSPLLLP